ncbi:MAG TPA: AI-2E family transporter, partial [Saprospiraceae bacterium]|nr:AI-2E family transporter [Saprospiraceae bacterium]
MQWLRNAAYILIVILGGGFLLLEGRDILFPFLFAVFFAFLLMPLEKFIYKYIPNKAVSITGSVVLVLSVVTGIIFIFGYQLIQIISDMNSIQAQLQGGIEEILQFIAQKVPFFKLPQDPAGMNEMMSRLLEAPIQYVGAGITSGAGFLFNVAL